MLYVLLFILGANIGSFLNVCIWRLPRGESVSHPPSHCPHCNTRLRALDYEFWQVWNRQVNFAQGFTLADSLLIAFPIPLPGSLAALVVVAGVLWALREFFSFVYQREAMGFGDVMLVGAIAANLGWNATLVTFAFLSVVVGALLMILMQLPRAIRAFRWAKERERRYGSTPAPPAALLRHAFRKGLPFGPMLAGGAVVALLYGVQLNAAYLSLWQA